MKIEFIGTGSIFASRNSASYLVNDKILVDIPNGNCKALKRMNKEIINISYVLITHFHGDHFLDIPFLLSEIYIKGNRKITLIGGSELKEKVEVATKLVFPNSYDKYLNGNDIIYIDCNENINIDNISIKSIEVKHGKMKECYGYIFTFNDKVFSFTGDTSLCDNVEELCSISDYLVIDTSMEKGNETHIGIDNLEYLAKKYKDVIFLTTHMRDNIRNEIKALNLSNVVVSEDGDIINL